MTDESDKPEPEHLEYVTGSDGSLTSHKLDISFELSFVDQAAIDKYMAQHKMPIQCEFKTACGCYACDTIEAVMPPKEITRMMIYEDTCDISALVKQINSNEMPDPNKTFPLKTHRVFILNDYCPMRRKAMYVEKL